MTSYGKRNAVGISLVILVTLAIIGGVVYVAVDSNRPDPVTEFFIDTAPVDYTTKENVIYVKKFRDAVNGFLAEITGINVSNFADQIVEAMSISRIPAEKLGGMADAVNQNDLTGLIDALNNASLTEEQIIELFETTSLEFVSSFLDGLFDKSGLTSEEFGLVLYNYLVLYGGQEYSLLLSAFGKDNFVSLIGDTAYFITTVNDVKEGTGEYVDSHAMSAAFYQLGTVFLKAESAAGVDTLEKVLLLRWNYGEDKNNYERINVYTAALREKIGYLIPLFGCVLRSVGAEEVEWGRLYADTGKDADLVYSQSLIAKSVGKGLNEFILSYGEKFGCVDRETLALQIKSVIENLYKAQTLTSGGSLEAEKFVERLNNHLNATDEFFDALVEMENTNYDYDTLIGMEKDGSIVPLADKARSLWALEDVADVFNASVIYMWSSQILYDLAGEVQ